MLLCTFALLFLTKALVVSELLFFFGGGGGWRKSEQQVTLSGVRLDHYQALLEVW